MRWPLFQQSLNGLVEWIRRGLQGWHTFEGGALKLATTLDVPVGPKKEKVKRRSRRGNPSTAENIRFFVGKPCRNKEAPQLEREVASEAEGSVAAFKTDASLFLLSEYTVMQRIERGRVTLGKDQPRPRQRVSTVNAS